MIKVFKIILLFMLMVSFICIFSLIKALFFMVKSIRTRMMSHAIHIFCVAAVIILGLKIKITGLKNINKEKGVFFVSNHVSYLDGIIASRMFPLIFIARGDLKNWPFFGLFSRVSETFFVNRLTPSGLHKEISGISSLLNDGVNVILFPEGTTTDGEDAVNFKSSFFQAAVQSNSQIVPFTIKYKKVNGKDLDERNKDLLFWYDDMGFLSHLLQLLSLWSIEANVNILEAIDAASTSRKSLSILSQQAITSDLAKAC